MPHFITTPPCFDASVRGIPSNFVVIFITRKDEALSYFQVNTAKYFRITYTTDDRQSADRLRLHEIRRTMQCNRAFCWKLKDAAIKKYLHVLKLCEFATLIGKNRACLFENQDIKVFVTVNILWKLKNMTSSVRVVQKSHMDTERLTLQRSS